MTASTPLGYMHARTAVIHSLEYTNAPPLPAIFLTILGIFSEPIMDTGRFVRMVGKEPLMDLIERKIQEARERGDFDNLPGAGKPLNLEENPFVPAEWRLAYSMLADSGFAPDIVESDKALRGAIAELAASLDRFAARWSRLSPSDRQARLDERAAFLRQYEADVRDVNSRIHSFNHGAPTAMQRGTLLVDRTMATATARLPIGG
ncbi:MAG: DUF1992 domain-containing protein [Chloroflexota bacterium]